MTILRSGLDTSDIRGSGRQHNAAVAVVVLLLVRIVRFVVVVQGREGNAAPHCSLLLLAVRPGLVVRCDGQGRLQQEVRHGAGCFLCAFFDKRMVCTVRTKS